MIEYTVEPITRWPKALTSQRVHDRFNSLWSQTNRLLEREIDFIEGVNVVLRVAVTSKDIRRDGLLRASARPDHPGVIVAFDSMHGSLAYACDTFLEWQSNVRAIALVLEALRKIDRYGVAGHGEQYSGFKQIAAPGGGTAEMDKHTAAEVLIDAAGEINTQPPAVIHDPEERKRVYREAARNTHPDLHGNSTRFQIVSQAYKVLGG